MMRSLRRLTAAGMYMVAFSPGLAAGDPGVAAAPEQRAHSDAAAPAVLTAAVPPVRKLDTGSETTGSEPDPEAFDQQGLDHWWQHHLEPAPARKEP
jgi:hypothetical protein